MVSDFFFLQAEDGIRDLVRSRGLGDVYKRQWQSHLGPGIGGARVDTAATARPGDGPTVGASPLDLSLIHI